MREYTGLFDYHPSLIGTMSAIAGTAIGAPIDTQSFADVMAILTVGALNGTGDGSSTVYVDVKIQESADPVGTGTAWTDITNRATTVDSFDFDQLTLNSTDPGMYMEKQYCRLRDSNRKRYLRAHATLTGTVGLGPKICVGLLLGRPSDTLYIANAETQATGNTECTQILIR